jgi:Flp pilus assembly protein TadB
MNERIDSAAQRAWQRQPSGHDNVLSLPQVDARLRDQRRRTRVFLVSAAIIVPTWIAAFWFRPDLRPVAAVGLVVAASLAWLVFRGGAARSHETALPCAAFQIAVLTRERDFHRAMPKYLIPVIVGQLAIVATLLVNPRFEKNAFFAGSLTAFIFTVGAVLLIVFRRSRRMLSEIERELLATREGVEA